MNRMPKYLVSQTITNPTWNNTIRLGPDLSAEVNRLRSSGQGEILVFGSGQLLQALHRYDQVDEYRLLTFPVIIGGGKRMFGDTAPLDDVSRAPRLLGVDYASRPSRGPKARRASASLLTAARYSSAHAARSG